MTNILAVLTILTVTNWESVGTFTDKKGQQFDVVEGVRCTNWTATFEFEGRQVGFVLKSARGDKCDEVKNPLATNVINVWTNWATATNYFSYTNGYLWLPIITNLHIGDKDTTLLNSAAAQVKHIDGPNTGHYDPTNMMYLKTDPEGAQPVDMNHATTNSLLISTNPVSVVLTGPSDGSVVSNMVTLSVNATSTVAPISRVEYYLDGNLIATVTNPITPPSQLHEN